MGHGHSAKVHRCDRCMARRRPGRAPFGVRRSERIALHPERRRSFAYQSGKEGSGRSRLRGAGGRLPCRDQGTADPARPCGLHRSCAGSGTKVRAGVGRGEGARGAGRFRRSYRPRSGFAGQPGYVLLDPLQAGSAVRSYPGGRGAGYQRGAVGDHRCVDGRFLLRPGPGRGPAAHHLRGGRLQAGDLPLPGHQPGEFRRRARQLRCPSARMVRQRRAVAAGRIRARVAEAGPWPVLPHITERAFFRGRSDRCHWPRKLRSGRTTRTARRL